MMTPRVYRLAKVTNKSDFVLLPGEATVYVGSDFVGRMRLPLVAAGEPFIAGFGVDTQLQVSRRLVRKSRSGRTDNLLLWDIQVPPGTIGDKTMYLNYEFRLEYARDLPQPRFVSGGLREGPIGGGAMGGMGGMGGGMRSVGVKGD
jgi:hypothetical protein